MMRRIFSYLTILLLRTTIKQKYVVFAYNTYGDEECPCINLYEAYMMYNNTSNSNVVTSPLNTCILEDGITQGLNISLKSDSGKYICVPPEFGASCDNWSGKYFMDRCENSGDQYDPDTFCGSKWCYINFMNCTRPSEDANLYQVPIMQRSFETCGNINIYSDDRFLDQVKGKTLRVAYPGDSSSKFDLYTNDVGIKDGSTVAFFNSVQEALGYSIEVLNISSDSLERYSSSYTACTHDVGLGRLDLCIGGFYDTSERQIISSLTTTFYSSDFYLFVPEKEGIPLRYMVWSPFKPFSMGAWFMIAFCSIYMAFVMSLIERLKSRRKSKKETWIQTLGNLSYISLRSFSSGEPPEPEEPLFSEKVVMSGYAIFGLIVLTAYTASSAAALVVDNSRAAVSSIDELLEKNYTACVRSVPFKTVKGVLGAYYPEEVLSTLLVECDNEGIMDYRLFNDDADLPCFAAIDAVDNFELYTADGNWCNLTKVGDKIISLSNVAPVSTEYERALSYSMSLKVNDGEYSEMVKDYKTTQVGKSMCNINDDSTQSGQTFVKLTIENLIFAFIVTGCCTSVGFFSYICQKHKDTIGLHLHEEDLNADNMLMERLQNLSGVELLQMIDSSNVSSFLFEKAVNTLPDTTGLIEIAFRQMCSQYTTDILFLEGLSTFQLYKILCKVQGIDNEISNKHLDDEKITEAMNSSEPKSALIQMIMNDFRRNQVNAIRKEMQFENSTEDQEEAMEKKHLHL